MIPAVHIFREIEEFLGPVRLSTARPITTVEAQNSLKTKTGLAQIQSRDILADRTGSKARMAAELDSQSLDRLSNRSPKATSTEKDASLPPPPQEVDSFTRGTAESFNSFDDQGTKSSLSPIATRDIYTDNTAIPHLRSTTSLLSRLLSDSGLESGTPILPSSTSGFTSSDSSIHGSVSNTPCPPFFTTEVHQSLQTSEGHLIKPEIFGKIDKGFFMAENDWTCYRRNYFSLNCSYTLQPTIPNGAIYLVGQAGGAGAQVHSFAMSIAAVVDGRDGKSVELVLHTPKRDKGPQDRPPRITLAPRPPASHDLYGGDSGLDGSKGNIYNTQGFDQTPNSPQIEATFERIQFKNATANNGRRMAAQQYFHLLVELFADVGPQHIDRWVKIASRMSAPLVVRGRSPGAYQGERRGSNTSTGPGGSGGTGSGGGAYTPGSASGTPGDITMSGTSSMLPGPGSGSGYDGRSPSNIALL
jgi:meiosis-specific transcription factor NDT80